MITATHHAYRDAGDDEVSCTAPNQDAQYFSQLFVKKTDYVFQNVLTNDSQSAA